MHLNICFYQTESCIKRYGSSKISLKDICRGITEGLPTMDSVITMFSKY
jgi:hypothetical protein